MGDEYTPVVSVDKEQLKTVLREVIEREVTAVVKNGMTVEDVAGVIRGAFNKSWTDNRDSWLEESIKTVTSNIMYQAVQKSLEAAGITELVDAVIKDFISTDDFKNNLKERALATVRETTFYVRPPKDGDEGESGTIHHG